MLQQKPPTYWPSALSHKCASVRKSHKKNSPQTLQNSLFFPIFDKLVSSTNYDATPALLFKGQE